LKFCLGTKPLKETSEKTPTVELKLPILENMELVATQTADVVSKHMKLSSEKSDEIKMALIEACINAFEHSKSEEQIFIHFIIRENNLTIKVIDKGAGFDSAGVAIPNIESKLNSEESKRGWGVMLIKELMDSVSFESDHTGTTVTMVKNLENDE
jgi:serine/threonine-protein kinase RsbW